MWSLTKSVDLEGQKFKIKETKEETTKIKIPDSRSTVYLNKQLANHLKDKKKELARTT